MLTGVQSLAAFVREVREAYGSVTSRVKEQAKREAKKD